MEITTYFIEQVGLRQQLQPIQLSALKLSPLEQKYIDDYFFVGKFEGTVETPFTNKVRFAQGQSLFKGFLVDVKV